MNRQDKIKGFFIDARGLLSGSLFEPNLGELVRLKQIVTECINDSERINDYDNNFYPAGEAVARFLWERYDIPVKMLQEDATPASLKQLREYLRIKREEMYLL